MTQEIKSLKVVLFLLVQTLWVNSIESQENQSLFTHISQEVNVVTPHFKMLSDSIADFQVCLLGENHDYKYSGSLSYFLFSEMLAKKKVNSLLLEIGYSGQYFLKKYIASDQNEKLLMSKKLPKTIFRYFKLYDELYLNHKFNIYAVDIERDFSSAFTALRDILLDNSYKGFEYVFNLPNNRLGNESLISTVDLAIKEFYQDSSKLKLRLPDTSYKDFDNIMKGMIYGSKYYWGYVDAQKGIGNIKLIHEGREKFIADRVLNIIDENPEVKCFGSFGRSHLLKFTQYFQGIDEWCSMSCRLLKHKVDLVRIMPLYKKDLKKREAWVDRIISWEHIPDVLSVSKSNRVTLFDFREKDKYNIFFNFDYMLYLK